MRGVNTDVKPFLELDGYPLHSGSHYKLWFREANTMRKREGLSALIALAVTGLLIFVGIPVIRHAFFNSVNGPEVFQNPVTKSGLPILVVDILKPYDSLDKEAAAVFVGAMSRQRKIVTKW